MPQFLIIGGGDTNTVFSRLDKVGGTQNLKCNAINAFKQAGAELGQAELPTGIWL